MKIELFLDALSINERYTLENLNEEYKKEQAGENRESKDYDSFMDIYDDIVEKQLISESPSESKDDDYRIMIDKLLKQIDEEIAKREKNNDLNKSEKNRSASNKGDNSLYAFFKNIVSKANEHKNVKTRDAGNQKSSVNQKELEDDINSFQRVEPQSNSSPYYMVLYFKTYIYWLSKQVSSPDFDVAFVGFVFSNELFLSQYYNSNRYINTAWKRLLFETDIEKSSSDQYQMVITHETKKAIRRFSKSVVETKKTTTDEFIILQFYAQLLLFLVALKHSPNGDVNPYRNEASSYLAHYIAESFLGAADDTSSIGMAFSKKSLNISDCSVRQDAFNTLGVLAIETDGQLQLANDVYCSWLKGKMEGSLCELFKTYSLQTDEELNWRKSENGKIQEAIMRGNYAYVSAAIGDTYEETGLRYKQFYEIAREQIEKAIELNEKSSASYCTYGSILLAQNPWNMEIIKKAIDQYNKYFEYAVEPIDKTRAINNTINSIMKLLVFSYVDSGNSGENTGAFSEWTKTDIVKEGIDNLIKKYKQYDTVPELKGRDRDSDNESKTKQAIINLMTLGNLFTPERDYSINNEKSEIVLIMILIDNIAKEILRKLRRRDYSTINYFTRNPEYDKDTNSNRTGGATIAYYTTLKTAIHLFDDLYQSSPDKAPEVSKNSINKNECKNCLTVVHAKYMNDPYEGLALLDSLTSKCKGINTSLLFPKGTSESFREKLFEETFIFLKSFTEKADNLMMWNRYASDYDDDGKNSNGCCIQFDPEMLNRIVSNSSENKSITSSADDDYNLYRMVYISSDGTIDRNQNKGISDLTIKLHNTLKLLIPELCKRLNTIDIETEDGRLFIDHVGVRLRTSLRSILFLFKSDDYAEEYESRLIFERKPDQQSLIRILPGDPPKLAINPFNQVYINRIVFGPNVRKQEEWKPFLQYKLNDMWKKYANETGDNTQEAYDRYIIENSTIHYHT